MPEANRHQTGSATPETQAMRGQLGQILQAAVDALPETYRSVFVLREVEQLSTIDTAESLGLSEEAVKTRLHRSRALLRRELEDRMGPAMTEAYAFMGSRRDLGWLPAFSSGSGRDQFRRPAGLRPAPTSFVLTCRTVFSVHVYAICDPICGYFHRFATAIG